jgi:hypothetical protein
MASPWEQAIRDSNGLLKVGRIHYDNQPSLARQFNLRHIPTVIAIYKGAQATLSFSGTMEDLNSNHLLDFAATLLSVRVLFQFFFAVSQLFFILLCFADSPADCQSSRNFHEDSVAKSESSAYSHSAQCSSRVQGHRQQIIR